MSGDPSFDEARRSLGQGPSQTRRGLQRARLLHGLTGPKRVSRAVMLILASVVVALPVVMWRQPQVLLRDGEGPIVSGARLIAKQVRTLEFSEGSQLIMSPGAELLVEAVDTSHVELVLERGHLEASVTKGTGRTWRYRAGPWMVRVVGTKLSIDWEPGAGTFVVLVTEGAVEVSAPGGAPVLVQSGETFERSVRQPEPPRSPVLSEAERPTPVFRPAHPEPRTPPPSEEPETLPEPAHLSWQQLLARGQRPEALDEASAAGVFAGPLDDDDALALADAARLERRGDLAGLLLSGVLERSGPNAAEAAFLLGRLEFDAHRPQSAQRLFSRSVSLAPDGPFVEQARGRLLEVLLELEDLPAARQVAHDYLRHHPNGAWERVASQLVVGSPR